MTTARSTGSRGATEAKSPGNARATRPKPPAPVFVDTFALCEWILGRLGSDNRILARSICRTTLLLMDQIAIALRRADPLELVEEADDTLVSLRVKLRLAAAGDLMSEEQMLFALKAADGIGRQLGGWRRALDAR